MIERKNIPFIYKGVTDISDCNNIEDAIVKANLNWSVEKKNLFYLNNNGVFSPVEGVFTNVRSDNSRSLGVVKSTYEIINNIEAFQFFDNAIRRGDAILQTAGCLDGGKKVFITAKIPNISVVGDNDFVDNYLLLSTSHDGSTGIRIAITPIRVVCFNMLHTAIAKANQNINIKHSGKAREKFDIAAQIINDTNVKIESLTKVYNELLETKCNTDFVLKYIGDCIIGRETRECFEKDGYNMGHILTRNFNVMETYNISSNKPNRVIEAFHYYENGPGQKEYVGTKWGAYNTMTGYYCNCSNEDGEKRMDSFSFGHKHNKIEQASKLILV